MGQSTGISWAHHTFNPWTGCTKVSNGCKFCYVERDTTRFNLQVFGPKAERQQRAASYWNQLPKWNREAIEAEERRRVFCMSQGDIWEDRPELAEPRKRTLGLIEECRALDFLMLTKRPQNVREMLEAAGFGHWLLDWPRHVWPGVSVEDQDTAELRLPYLFDLPAGVRWLSCEPLIGPVSLPYVGASDELTGCADDDPMKLGYISWVVVGGESGATARPMVPRWARQIRDDCTKRGVPFWWKQWGRWVPCMQPFGSPRPKHGRLVDDPGHPAALMVPTQYTEGVLDGEAIRQLPKERLAGVFDR